MMHVQYTYVQHQQNVGCSGQNEFCAASHCFLEATVSEGENYHPNVGCILPDNMPSPPVWLGFHIHQLGKRPCPFLIQFSVYEPAVHV